MSDRPTIGQDDARRAQIAGGWLLRLNEDNLSEAHLSEWIEWCESDSKNRQVFDELQSLWRAAAEHPPDAHSLLQLRRTDPSPASRPTMPTRTRGRPWLAIAASIALLVVGALFIAHQTGSGIFENKPLSMARVVSVETPLVANQQAILPDGSNVELGARSVLDVDFAGTQRKLHLRNGQAFFRVKHDALHPFVVDAGAIRVTAVGTAFDVRRSTAQVAVTVQEGTVEVQNSGSATEPIRATAGYQLVFDTATGKTQRSIVDTEMAMAWRSGRLEFNGDTLEVVIASINRYSSRPIVLGDPALGRLAFTGTVFVDSIDASLDALPQVFPIDVHRSEREIILAKRP
jgi:transmembrane sensor